MDGFVQMTFFFLLKPKLAGLSHLDKRHHTRKGGDTESCDIMGLNRL